MKYKTFLVVSILYIVIFSLNIENITFAQNKEISITSHRGSCYYCNENSIKSIEKAIESGCDYVEIDLRTTKDNKIILSHDDNLKRLYNKDVYIKELTLQEINNISNGEIPTLEEVFKDFKHKIKFNLELKVKDQNDILPMEVSKLINKYDMDDYVLVTSFNKKIICDYKTKNKSMKVGYISNKKNEDYVNLNIDVLSLNYKLINEELVKELHNNNKEVHVWTVNDEKTIKEALNMGVDNIITDDVSLVKKIKDI